MPPVALVRVLDTVRARLQGLHRRLAPGGINLLELGIGAWVTQTIYVAAKLGIADELAEGPLRADEVARRVGTHPDATFRLMRALASNGVLRQRRDGRFALTSVGRAMRTDAPGTMRGLMLWIGHPKRWEDWGHLMYSVRTGEPATEMLRGMPTFEYLETDPELAEAFNNAMTSTSEFAIHSTLAAYDFARYRTVVDVGGGHGRLLSAILTKVPGARGVLFDLPSVVEGAEEQLTSAGVVDRCEVVGGSFFDSVPEGADAYTMKSILHDWNDDDAERILRNIRTAIAPEGKLLLLESVLPQRPKAHPGAMFDLEMMVALHGKERTRAEWTALLGRGGFRLDRVVDTVGPLAVIEASPA
ncbi:methyltransferase [Mycolicibacterium sp. XJ1819]